MLHDAPGFVRTDLHRCFIVARGFLWFSWIEIVFCVSTPSYWRYRPSRASKTVGFDEIYRLASNILHFMACGSVLGRFSVLGRYILEVLSKFYRISIEILSKFYWNSIEILSKFYWNSIEILLKFYRNSIEILSKFYWNSIEILLKVYWNSIENLLKNYWKTIEKLY